ncbi:MAG: AraC-like DNA-binding protein [Saprospiraceae bacterium]
MVVAENVFIQKKSTIVEKYLEDLEFNVEQFCKEIGMSRSQLHRKITALTGLSPNKFIRHIRLRKAKLLLQNPELTINAIAYKTGFNGQNYFGRMFKSEFGMSPMEWRKSEVEEM